MMMVGHKEYILVGLREKSPRIYKNIKQAIKLK